MTYSFTQISQYFAAQGNIDTDTSTVGGREKIEPP
jgi:hypothetical protein